MRSILFLPTDKIERLPKALGSGADKVIFDLEDGLAHDKKALGRSNFADLANRNFDGQPDKFLLRINANVRKHHQLENLQNICLDLLYTFVALFF